MGVTTERSTLVQVQEGTIASILSTLGSSALRAQVMPFSFTQGAAAGDATSTAALVKMPAGKHKVLGIAVVCSAFGASRVLDIGYEAHTNTAGAAVNADADAFKNDLDVSAAATSLIALNTDMDSAAGYVVNATVAGGTIPAGATLAGWVLFAN